MKDAFDVCHDVFDDVDHCWIRIFHRNSLVMIDGIQVTDPSQIANDYDFNILINTMVAFEVM